METESTGSRRQRSIAFRLRSNAARLTIE